MDILITGRLGMVTREMIAPLARNHQVAAASDDVEAAQLGNTATPFRLSPQNADFEKVFHSYQFQAAVFLSQPLYTGTPYYEEYQDLENCLRLCAAHEVHQVLYLQPELYGQRQESGVLPDHDLGMLFSACEQLCSYYRQKKGISIIVCHIPSVYGYGETASVVGRALHQAVTTAAVQFGGQQEQPCGYLSETDLGELLLRMLENWTTAYDEIEVPALTRLTFGELGALLKEHYPTLRLSYRQQSPQAAAPRADEILRREYDWIPLLSLEEELPELVRAQERAPEGEPHGILARVSAFLKKHSLVVKMVELALGFVLMELLNRVAGTTIQFQYIDFRLLYIVLMGTLHGMWAGLAAAGLASVSLLISFLTYQTNWVVTAYDIDTWLPFIFFFLIGAVTGYIKDRLRNENRFLTEEKALLEEKYVLLNEFYVSALQNKDKYKRQILSYRDSFGRLFDITKSLDSTVVDEIFREALVALEGVLDNRSVALYSCDEKMLFGRLVACSREVAGVTAKSLNLSRLENMTREFRHGEVWVNRDRLLGYPEYAVPLYRDGTPIALILLQKASYEQMAVYYENLIKIICGLIKISLVRALEYTEQIEKEIYLPDSHILTNAYFSQIVQAREEMAKNGVSEYVLIRLSAGAENQKAIAQRLSGLIRQTDVLGLGNDGELYLCLAQTNQSNLHFVLDRIRQAGLAFHETEAGEAV